MKKLLLLLLVATSALAQENPILNVRPDQDTVIKVNDGGVITTVLRAKASDSVVEISQLRSLSGGAVNFPNGATGITAQVTDFNLTAVLDPTLTLGGGYITLNDGRELATYSGAGSTASSFGGNLSPNLNTVAGNSGLAGCPTDGTCPANGASNYYYLYVNLGALPAAITQTDTGRKVYPVTSTELVLTTTPPDLEVLGRYFPLGFIKGATAGNSWSAAGSAFGSYATKKGAIASVMANPTVYTLAKQAVGAVGSSGQILAGHVLQTTEWPFTFADNIAFWNLSSASDNSAATSCTGGTIACDLTNSAVTFAGTDIFGGSTAAVFNGAANLNSVNTFFNNNGLSLGVGGWFLAADWTNPGTLNRLFSGHLTGSDLAWTIVIDVANSQISFSGTNSASSVDTDISVPIAFANNSWHHIAMVFDNPNDVLKAYIDGRFVASKTLTNIRNTATPIFRIGASYAGTEFLTGRAEEAFFTHAVLADEDVRKLYSYRIDHNKSVLPANQRWSAEWERTDSNVSAALTSGFVVDKRTNSLYADFGIFNSVAGTLSATDKVTLSMTDAGLTGTAVPTRTYDSGYLSAAPSFPITHNLPAVPTALILQHEDGDIDNLPVDSYCGVNATQINCDLTGLTIDATHRIRVIASTSAHGIAVPPASTTQDGLVTSDEAVTQTMSGNKVLQNSTTSSSVLKLATSSVTTAPVLDVSGTEVAGSNNGIRVTIVNATINRNIIEGRSGAAGAESTRFIVDGAGTTTMGYSTAPADTRFVRVDGTDTTFPLVSRSDDNSAAFLATNTPLALQNLQAGGAWAVNQVFQFQTTAVNGGTPGSGAILRALQEQTWTATASTQDGAFAINTARDGSTTEGFRINSNQRVDLGSGTSSTQAHRSYGAHALAAGSIIVGQYPTNPTGTSCDASCQAGDGVYGFDTDSGICLHAWVASTGVPTTCADASGTRACMCTGYVAN